MPDLYLLQDEATSYVLGRMTEAERGEFEACLAESAELRALVRELEEGAVAVAMASPRRRVPQQVWERIEQAVTEETRPRMMKASFWIGWLSNGWAAAAACLAGWMLYTFWVDRDVAPSTIASEANGQSGGVLTDSLRTETDGATSEPQNFANTERRPLQTNLKAMTRENGALRFQNAELARQVSHLSQMVTQQQVLLSESSRLKFFQLAPTSDGFVGATNAIPSPALQRALFLAMARELGWLQSGEGNQSDSTLTNQLGVDFVDLHPSTNETKTPFNFQAQIEPEPTDPTESESESASPSNSGIPVVAIDDKMFFAFDPSSGVVTPGEVVSFWTGNSTDGHRLLGSAMVGANTTMVSFQATGTTRGGTPLTVTAETPSGFFHVIGQLFLQETTPP